ncbi:MAG: sugar phosphate isomerase/epimerase [Verrucomicrobia bacterium]|nr:sugar phosphate isomerase/epimerase [Verrucomicrobiota bacterium]
MTVPLEPQPLRWCFSTLGCADLSFPRICELANEFRIPGIELRGIAGRMDMPQYCAEQSLTPAQMLNLCRRQRTSLVVAGSSAKLIGWSDKDRAELQAFGTWAEALNIPYVRVFGGGTWGKALTDSQYAHAVELVHWWQTEKAARSWQVDLLLETHDGFSASEPCLRLNQRLEEPLHLIWDTHHTWRLGKESPESTWERIGPLVRHVHIKDSMDQPSARHPYTYVGLGAGQMPLQEVMGLLREQQFGGFVSLEWERLWHPYLAPLHEALAELQDQPWFEAVADEQQLTNFAG